MDSLNQHGVQMWYAVHTNPRQEARTAMNLEAWGVRTLAPKVRSHTINSFTGECRPVVKPLFLRYIFAHFDASSMLHKVRFTRGVERVVCFGAKPTPVDDEIIDIISSRSDEAGCVVQRPNLSKGDRVRIVAGPFADFVGIFENECTDAERVSVLMNLMSRTTRLVVERACVVPAGM